MDTIKKIDNLIFSKFIFNILDYILNKLFEMSKLNILNIYYINICVYCLGLPGTC